MIETRAGFLKLHSPHEKYKDGQFTSEYRHVWMNRSAIRGLTASNGTMGSKTFVYAPDVPAYGRGAFAWECIESIEDILDAIERIDKSATMHQTDTTQKEGT